MDVIVVVAVLLVAIGDVPILGGQGVEGVVGVSERLVGIAIEDDVGDASGIV